MVLEGLDLLMELIGKSQYIVALTGAGISTRSGIPDFRGPKGIYSRGDIPGEQLFDIKIFRENPSLFYTHIGELFEGSLNAQPSLGHRFLKKLEDLGKLKCVITQNIDGLHHKAGNTNIISVHGDFENFVDLETNELEPVNDKIIAAIRKKQVPKNKAGHVLKPNIVFFGEPVSGLEKALTEVQKADLLICMGTSLQVYPVAQLPGYLTDETKLVIMNQGSTPYDKDADLVLDMDIEEIVKKTGLI